MDGPEPCLVYQFMANGSLDDRLQNKKVRLDLLSCFLFLKLFEGPIEAYSQS